MNIKARKEKLAQLTKDVSKSDDVNLADIKDPQEYAHRVFEMLVSNLDDEGLDE